MADEVSPLNGEPDAALAIEDERVRITRGTIRHCVRGGLSGRGIQTADPCVTVSCVPDDTGPIHYKVVGEGACLDLEPAKLAGNRIEATDVVPLLPHEPHRAPTVHIRIAGTRFGPRYRPLGDLYRVGVRGRGGIRAGAGCAQHQHG